MSVEDRSTGEGAPPPGPAAAGIGDWFAPRSAAHNEPPSQPAWPSAPWPTRVIVDANGDVVAESWPDQNPVRGFLIDEDDLPPAETADPKTSEPPGPDAPDAPGPERLPRPTPALSSRNRSGPGKNTLRLLAVLLPGQERSEWLEEQRGYLADLPGRRARWAWIASQLVAMPRYAYTVRTGSGKEPA